jgi:hypothetical protein
MRFALTAVAAFAALTVALPAQAQTAKKRVYTNSDHTVSVMEDEDGRKRTKIIVQRRSYLDAGTNVLPGERKYNDYVFGPSYSATAPIDNTVFNRDRQILPGPFDLPGPRNPGQF